MKTMTIALTAEQARALAPVSDALTLLGKGSAAIAQVFFMSDSTADLQVGVLPADCPPSVRAITVAHAVDLSEPEEPEL